MFELLVIVMVGVAYAIADHFYAMSRISSTRKRNDSDVTESTDT